MTNMTTYVGLIIDNAGGIVLQTATFIGYFGPSADEIENLADCIQSYLADGDTSCWEGHNPDLYGECDVPGHRDVGLGDLEALKAFQGHTEEALTRALVERGLISAD